MKYKLIARRYGEAYLFYAMETIGVEKCVEELQALRRIMKDSPEMMTILKGHGMTLAEKFGFIDNIFGKYFSSELLQFLKFLAEKERAGLLPDIISFVMSGVTRVEEVDTIIKSAYPLDPAALGEIKQRLEAKYNKILRVSAVVDKSILGGVRVEMGNTLIDGSLKGRLSDMKDQIEIARAS